MIDKQAPPSCMSGGRCREEVTCTPETCPHGQKGWKHVADCVRHVCAHDFRSGPSIDYGSVFTASCACGVTAYRHSMMYGP